MRIEDIYVASLPSRMRSRRSNPDVSSKKEHRLKDKRRKASMKQIQVSLREATIEDAPTIAKLHASSWQVTYRGILPDDYLDTEVVRERASYWETRMRTPVEGDRLILIAECDASAAGFACGEREPHTRDGVLLNNLHVLPSHHGRGLGKLMVDAIEDWARKLGETQLYLHVVEENRQAIAFYERQGWRFSGAESHHIAGTPVTALRYVRPIV